MVHADVEIQHYLVDTCDGVLLVPVLELKKLQTIENREEVRVLLPGDKYVAVFIFKCLGGSEEGESLFAVEP